MYPNYLRKSNFCGFDFPAYFSSTAGGGVDENGLDHGMIQFSKKPQSDSLVAFWRPSMGEAEGGVDKLYQIKQWYTAVIPGEVSAHILESTGQGSGSSRYRAPEITGSLGILKIGDNDFKKVRSRFQPSQIPRNNGNLK